MAKERLKSPRLRLFVALDLPESVRVEVERWRTKAFAREDRVRLPPAASLHFTLAFLGYQYERDLERIAEAATTAIATAAPELHFEREPVGIPRRRPRLYALEAAGEGILTLAQELHGRLEMTRLWQREKRPLWPHLTIAKMRPERRGSRRPARLSSAPPSLPETLTNPFLAERLILYRSILHPHGAEYVPVAQATLRSG